MIDNKLLFLNRQFSNAIPIQRELSWRDAQIVHHLLSHFQVYLLIQRVLDGLLLHAFLKKFYLAFLLYVERILAQSLFLNK
jgi:hypothetical protein